MRWVAVEKRRRLAKPKRIREGERIYNVRRRLSKEELERIHARTLFEFGRHRGTRLSLSLLEHRAVPSTRK